MTDRDDAAEVKRLREENASLRSRLRWYDVRLRRLGEDVEWAEEQVRVYKRVIVRLGRERP